MSKLPMVILICVFAGYIAFTMLRKPASTPGVFDAKITLTEAQTLSAETGKPILVLATADWCPPCQSLKRGALQDPAVVKLIGDRTIPVYLEDGANREELQTLPVRSYPTTLLIQGEEIRASIAGGKSASKYLKVLQEALADAG